MSKCRWVDTSDKVAGQDNGYLNFLFVLLKTNENLKLCQVFYVICVELSDRE
jgi:hypothetical protein